MVKKLVLFLFGGLVFLRRRRILWQARVAQGLSGWASVFIRFPSLFTSAPPVRRPSAGMQTGTALRIGSGVYTRPPGSFWARARVQSAPFPRAGPGAFRSQSSQSRAGKDTEFAGCFLRTCLWILLPSTCCRSLQVTFLKVGAEIPRPLERFRRWAMGWQWATPTSATRPPQPILPRTKSPAQTHRKPSVTAPPPQCQLSLTVTLYQAWKQDIFWRFYDDSYPVKVFLSPIPSFGNTF